MIRHGGAIAAVLLVVGSGAGAQLTPTARPSRDWRPTDRTIVGDFTWITSVAAASNRIYATSPASLLIWNPQFERWEGAFDPPEPGLLSRVFTGLVDPLDNSLWLGRPDGWVHYQPDVQQWTSGTAAGVVQEIAFDLNAPAQGLLLRTSAGWQAVPRGGFTSIPAAPPGRPAGPIALSELLRSSPALQANSAQILLDNRMRSVRFTAAARAFDRRGVYIGTAGNGLLYLPEGSAIPQRLSFGLPGGVIGAVYSAPGGVWAGNDRTAQSEAGITFVASDLSDFQVHQGPAATGFPFSQIRRFVGQADALWAATDFGVARMESETGRVRVIDQAAGLPDSRVYAIVSRRGHITAATARGIVRIDDSLRVRRVAPSFTSGALALALSGDTTWAGTGSGLLMTIGDSSPMVRPPGLNTASLQVPVVGLAWLGDTLVAMTEEQLMWRAPHGGWSLGPRLSPTVGRLRALAASGNGFWVGGDLGIAYARLTSPALRPLLTGDVPGQVFDLAVDLDYLWVATSGGLARFRLDAIAP
ncbi:MAG: hypothetical protein ABI637_00375 [Gemmatimonadota bacterium]